MQTSTRKALHAYTSQLALLSGVASATEQFTIAPSVEQTLEKKVQEQAEFLGQINVVPVTQQKGRALKLGAGKPAAGRTDTTLADRAPRDIKSMEGSEWEVHKTDFDTSVSYDTLDTWSEFPEFQTMMRDITTEQVARDRLTIGWNGTSAAATTDLAANPLLQDVNKGWLQVIREQAPQRHLSGLKIGPQDGADYRNFDAAVFDAVNNLIAPWHRRDSGLVVICSEELLNEKYLALLNSADGDKPTEKNAIATLLANILLGNRRVLCVPFFPLNSLLVTNTKNLSIYWQKNSHRRQIIDNPKRDRVEDYLSVNEAYVVEDLSACALLDGILLPDAAGTGWE
ncbi:MAG: phage major capsid protein, P2 family [Rhodospirillaceae bacterium]|nr:phage major capsid protein, P2 family [Rhodospirillales bacterium]